MANECTVEVISKPGHWLRIVQELLSQAGIRINGPEPWDIRVHDTRFFKRVLQQGSLGLGESYMEGWWDCKQLDAFFDKLLRARLDEQRPARFADLMRIAAARLVNPQSRRRAWQVGEVHYDLGNDLFSRMLDPHMQYSCGYWKNADELCAAQEDKLALICEKLQLKPGMTLLDIGCGWGGLAEYAARHYGVSVEGITISAEQKAYAESHSEGLDIRILLQDYRDLDKRYDRIVSVGMFEHVGPKNYATYFSAVDRCLKPDGLFLLHSIGSNKSLHNVDAWINKYIFPNGCLPSLKQIAEASEPYFVIEDVHNFGADYDKTLMAWHRRFNQAWPQIAGNYSTQFHRMFNYYLTACAGAFRARNIQLWQIVLSRGVTGGLRVAR
ncbi:cyclopropane fatty acyl phospholipid synthase [Kosakonia pseudosacchari]|uniref:Cyclopropane-fatty-acyl-phospholipid synthase n=1 Tax=Kosakonia pseudosacchari TaxID=1646340 RepID=A0ABX4IVE8_9ENTR|nr:cyclopropane fatty acyl phospholipid synthase [Kosakonia pseudosacchari]PDO90445.1 cyclopropane-fatty-acyl-phospholipid synthase [Kosakonia pseudosacchari]WBU51325.1 cyclopropane fatty acyl phospholipid synthase [Kosakonia pseudosacchari]